MTLNLVKAFPVAYSNLHFPLLAPYGLFQVFDILQLASSWQSHTAQHTVATVFGCCHVILPASHSQGHPQAA